MMPLLSRRCHKGAALVGILAAVLLFSILAAAMVPMVSSSSRQSIAGSHSTRAYLLAESGYRYAASEFLHTSTGTSEHDQNDTLENLDGDYVLNNNEGIFNLKVFSYFYETTLPVASGDTQFSARAPGNFPDAVSLSGDSDDQDGVKLDAGLKIKIGDDTYTLGSDSVQTSDDTVTFDINGSMQTYPADTPVYPVAFVDLDRTPTLDDGQNVAYEPDDADMFPLRNGTIQINGRTLTYRFNNRTANQFEHVTAPNHPGMDDFDLSAGSGVDPEIILTRYVRLHSTGIYGSRSDTDEQIRRRVVYYTSLPLTNSGAQQQEFTDRFDLDDNNWTDSHGDVSSQNVGGDHDQALTVDSAPTSFGQKGALTTIAPDSDAAAAINFRASHRSTLGYLSYDTQIKVGYEPPRGVFGETDPDHGYDPDLGSPVPAYVGAGLSLRLKNTADLFTNNGYGLSILRGNSTVLDDIPDEWVPVQNQRALVLWRQTGDGANRTWLAYKRLADLVLDIDDEPLLDEHNETAGSNAFNRIPSDVTNLWADVPSSRQRAGSTRNWAFSRTVFAPVRDAGALRSDFIELPSDADNIYLNFWGWHENAPAGATREIIINVFTPPFSFTTLNYSLGGGQIPDIVGGPVDGWYQYEIDLSTYAGSFIRIAFSFDTGSVQDLDPYDGWYIDDIQLNTQWSAADLQEATLALSIKEAMVVPFFAGTEKIKEGDRIRGNDNNTVGTVLMPPLISSGFWDSNDAEGTLLLNNTTTDDPENAFSFNEELEALFDAGSARVNDWDGPNDQKADILFVYLATKNGRGDPSAVDPPTPVDHHTLAYGRIGLSETTVAQLQWPPVLNDDGNWTDDDGNWTASEDYFQLIEWDAINNSASGLSWHPFTVTGQGVAQRAVLQSHHDTLESPDFPELFDQPEIGLHAMGDGADNIYFDDFGIRLTIYNSNILPSPIQQ